MKAARVVFIILIVLFGFQALISNNLFIVTHNIGFGLLTELIMIKVVLLAILFKKPKISNAPNT